MCAPMDASSKLFQSLCHLTEVCSTGQTLQQTAVIPLAVLILKNKYYRFLGRFIIYLHPKKTVKRHITKLNILKTPNTVQNCRIIYYGILRCKKQNLHIHGRHAGTAYIEKATEVQR
jgi:hypothetical protein